MLWQVVSYLKNGTQMFSKPMHYDAAYRLWERKSSRSNRRFSVRKYVEQLPA